jgi:hypothetical protein
MPFHAANVVEPLLNDVKPLDWTSVSKDDALMLDLLAVWFRCEYSFASAFQKDFFLEDMASHSQDFCSELLVNVVLAYCWREWLLIPDSTATNWGTWILLFLLFY